MAPPGQISEVSESPSITDSDDSQIEKPANDRVIPKPLHADKEKLGDLIDVDESGKEVHYGASDEEDDEHEAGHAILLGHLAQRRCHVSITQDTSETHRYRALCSTSLFRTTYLGGGSGGSICRVGGGRT